MARKANMRAAQVALDQQQVNPDAIFIRCTFALDLDPSHADPVTRDLADHLLRVVIPSASLFGSTLAEIKTWIAEEAIKLPEAAFNACVSSLIDVLAHHPDFVEMVLPLLEAKHEAASARKLVHEFEQARALIASLKLQHSVGLIEKIGVPSHLINALRKTGPNEDWYPPLAYLTGMDGSCLSWATQSHRRVATSEEIWP